MVKVRFYGSLKQFGTAFNLKCRDVAEVIRALTSQIQGLRQHLQNGTFKVRIGRNYIDNRFIEKGMFYKLKDGTTVHITPVIKGAKRAGVFQTILGAVLVVVGFATSWTGVGAYVGQAGIALMLGGVAQMLTKPPTQSIGSEQDKKTSTSFSNLQNMVAQGRIVPLAYGKIRTGSLIISQGVETYDAESGETSEAGFRKGSLI